MGMIAIAVEVGGWQGNAPTVLLAMGTLGVVLGGLVLGLTMLRGRE